MDLQIALLLGQDGIINGAIYGLMALALVLVFSVTRVIFVPQGDFVAFAALSMAALNAGKTRVAPPGGQLRFLGQQLQAVLAAAFG